MDEGRTLLCLRRKRYWRSIHFRIGDSEQRLVLTAAVLNHIAMHQQIGQGSPEAGGQLFARFRNNQIRVERATGPRAADRRSRYGYVPDRFAEQQEIDEMHNRGLHFIGDWHTHPQRLPRPSPSDIHSIRQAFRQSKHHLNGFVLLIAGTEVFPYGLFVSLYDSLDEAAVVLDSSRVKVNEAYS